MSTVIWASTAPQTGTIQLSKAGQLAALAVAEHRVSAYYAKWLAQNPKLGPLVDAYLSGGPRPPAASIVSNHYGLALVLTEDIRRNG